MALRERLIYSIDVVTDGAKKGLAGFKSSVSEAEGTVGKFKAGASSAFATIQANAGLLAVSAGGALVAFGIKAVGAFTDVAKAAIDGSAATGIAIEDYSRWIAVADDMQVSAESLQTGLGKIGKTLDSGKWEKYGVATHDAGGKARDANDILLDAFDTLGKISNETERARVGNDLFGKGYANLAPLIGKTRAEYEQYLGAVEDGQVVTEEEAAKAEKTRLALDRLHDSLQEIALAVGQAAAPAVAELADNVSDLSDSVFKLRDALNSIPGMPKAVQLWWDNLSPKALLVDKPIDVIRGIGSAFGFGGDEAEEAAPKIDRAKDSIVGLGGATADAADKVTHHRSELEIFHDTVDLATAAIDMKADADAAAAAADEHAAAEAKRHAEAVEAVADAMEKQRSAALELVGGDIAVRESQRRARQAAEELNETLQDQETDLGEAGAAIDEAADAQLNAAASAAEYRAKQMEANGEAVDARTQAQLYKEELQNLVGQLDGPLAAALQKYIDQLAAIPKTVGTTIVLTQQGRVGDTVSAGRLGGGIQRFATGGVVQGPVGSPQLAIVHAGETVIPQGASAAASGWSNGGGMSVQIGAVYLPNVTDPNQFMDGLARAIRMQGPGPLRRQLGIAG